LKLRGDKLKATLLKWEEFAKSPSFLPICIKFLVWLLVPLIAYFQDFNQVFSLAWSDAEAQYVLIVPFAVLYFFYRRRSAFLVNRKFNLQHDFLGIALCILALYVYITGSYSFYALQLHLISFPLFIAGLTLLLFGADALKLLLFPIALTAFLSPFPLFFMDILGGPLMTSDGALAAAILSPFIPIEVVYQPIVILTTLTTAGETVQFSLSAACSGIYSLTAFLFCAVVFGYLASGSIFKKLIYGALAIAAAYLLNVLRIVITVTLGHFYGLTLATEFFHAVGGTVLAFLGTLLLLVVGSKLLKLSFISKKPSICGVCKSTSDVCVKCGRVFHWPQTRFKWKRLALVLIFLAISADLISLASQVNYNVVNKDKDTALMFNPSTGQTDVFTNSTGYQTIFMGRENQAEEQLSLLYVGDYYLTKTEGTDTVYAIFELSDLQSKFHTWEGCLHYQSYEINIEKINYLTVYSGNTSIVNGETITAAAPSMNQHLVLLYWFDTISLQTNGTVTSYAVKMTLLKYVPDINGQADNSAMEAAKASLTALSQTYEESWSAAKQVNSSFVVDLYKNSATFLLVSVGLLIVAIVAVVALRLSLRFNAKKKFGTLPEADQTFIKNLTATQSTDTVSVEDAAKIETFRQQKIIYQKVIALDDNTHVKWAQY
jgi:exosortase